MAGKLKTNKSVHKRIRKTKSGKYKKMRAGKRHLNTSKSSKRLRHMRAKDLVSGGYEKSLRRLLPYA